MPEAGGSTGTLRVIDFGSVGSLRSQTLWHALAYGVGAGSPPTLSFVRTTHPYVCMGFHGRVEDVDVEHCARSGWPLYRRMVGGGPVYLDGRQLCFQISLPDKMVPASRPRALRWLLEPATEAFRAAGLDATLDPALEEPELEIVVGDRKVCGHGAAQIGSAVVVVGNLIEGFDHVAAASVLRAPRVEDGEEALRLMRRFVAFDHDAPAVDASVFAASAAEAFGRVLGLTPRPGGLSAEEETRLGELDRRLGEDSWSQSGRRDPAPTWQVKVRAGVWLYSVRHGTTVAAASVVHDRIDRLRVADEDLGEAADLCADVGGRTLGEAGEVLGRWGEPGRRVAAALGQVGALSQLRGAA